MKLLNISICFIYSLYSTHDSITCNNDPRSDLKANPYFYPVPDSCMPVERRYI